MFKKLAAIAVTALLCSTSVQAADFKFTFTASDFVSVYYHDPAPQSVVRGSFIVSAASISSAPTAIKAFDLVIDNHQYMLPEIEFEHYAATFIGGANNGISGIAPGTNDFLMSLYAGKVANFVYSSAGNRDEWAAISITSTYTEVTAVPEPETYAMLLAGLGLMGFVARRRKNQA